MNEWTDLWIDRSVDLPQIDKQIDIYERKLTGLFKIVHSSGRLAQGRQRMKGYDPNEHLGEIS